ncbi:MAG TPA: alkyl sulfatase dimerization domain-containing protein [Candidatus Binataceae bacterium]
MPTTQNRAQAGPVPQFDPLMGKLEVLEPGLALFHGFANVSFAYGRGEMLAADTSSRLMGAAAVAEIRKVTDEPFAYLIYTHGHLDHAFGTEAFIRDALSRGHMRPKIWAHDGVTGRFERYARTAGWQQAINQLQFGVRMPDAIFAERSFNFPDLTYRGHQFLDLAGEPVELQHAMGETDDATWVWLPNRRAALVGDLIVSSMPNTGNPNKVQRFTLEWAEALEAIAAKRPNFILPGHGPAFSGSICDEVLRETARALRFIHDEVVRRLNSGQWPIDIVEAGIDIPADLAAKPFLQPIYGCVPFVVRDVIRRYAGWWSGEPSQMFPAPRRERAGDIVTLCGSDQIIAAARSLLEEGKLKRALAMAEIACSANPDDAAALSLNAEILDRMAAVELSFIARNFFLGAARSLSARTVKK